MTSTNYRILHARLSREAHIRARIAALESDLSFRDYLDRLLRTAQPIRPPANSTADNTRARSNPDS